MRNQTVLYEAMIKLQEYVNPFIFDVLSGIFGEAWWNKGVTVHLRGDYRKQYNKETKTNKRMEMIDYSAGRAIISGNKDFFEGKRTKVNRIIDARFFDLYLSLNKVRNPNSHPSITDISNAELSHSLDRILEVCSYFSDSASEEFDPYYNNCISNSKTNGYSCASVVKKGKKQEVIANKGEERAPVSIIKRTESLSSQLSLDHLCSFDQDENVGPVYGDHEIKYPDGSKYEGDILNDARHGFGVMIRDDGFRYNEGLYHNDSYIGKIITSEQTDIVIGGEVVSKVIIQLSRGFSSYKGYFFKGAMNGFGTMFHPDGSELAGYFMDNSFISCNLTLYDGDNSDYYNLGEYVGRILMESDDGSFYSGFFNKGVKEGYGIYHKEGDYDYRGKWMNNHPEDDDGECSFVTGDRYCGGFRSGFINGYGVYDYADGTRYRGFFNYGYRHGEGVYSYDGVSIKGNWINDSLEGDVEINQYDYCTIKAKIRNNILYGTGIMNTRIEDAVHHLGFVFVDNGVFDSVNIVKRGSIKSSITYESSERYSYNKQYSSDQYLKDYV